MYPNIDPTGGAAGGTNWKSKLPSGFDQSKIPAGATDVKVEGGLCIFTVDGKDVKYNSDGSIFQEPAPAKSEAASDKTPKQGQGASASKYNPGASVWGGGFAQSGFDFTSSWMNGGYHIDPGTAMGTSRNFFSGIMGGFLGLGFLTSMFNGFMGALRFNFDFSNLYAKPTSDADGSQADAPTEDPHPGYEKVEGQNGRYTKDGVTYHEDNNGNLLANGEGGLPDGATAVDGKDNLYKSGEKYYKYDSESHKYVECKADGSNIESSSSESAALSSSGSSSASKSSSSGSSGTSSASRSSSSSSSSSSSARTSASPSGNPDNSYVTESEFTSKGGYTVVNSRKHIYKETATDSEYTFNDDGSLKSIKLKDGTIQTFKPIDQAATYDSIRAEANKVPGAKIEKNIITYSTVVTNPTSSQGGTTTTITDHEYKFDDKGRLVSKNIVSTVNGQKFESKATYSYGEKYMTENTVDEKQYCQYYSSKEYRESRVKANKPPEVSKGVDGSKTVKSGNNERVSTVTDKNNNVTYNGEITYNIYCNGDTSNAIARISYTDPKTGESCDKTYQATRAGERIWLPGNRPAHRDKVRAELKANIEGQINKDMEAGVIPKGKVNLNRP